MEKIKTDVQDECPCSAVKILVEEQTKELRAELADALDLDTRRPHRTGVTICSECGHRQVSVALADVRGPLECGRCHAMAADFDLYHGLTYEQHRACMVRDDDGVLWCPNCEEPRT